MNGSANGHSVPDSTTTQQGDGAELLPRIQEALQAIHSPHTSNESRQAASTYLEAIKSEEAAPYHGFVLANDKSQSTVVRHFALSLLEHAIKHKWASYSDEQWGALRGWIVQLSQQLSPDDPVYIRNKIAQLWTEAAKKCWGDAWLDMDSLLVQMWQASGSLIAKEFVLLVLETLSEDIFSGEDTSAALREGVLNKACVEIFTPASILTEMFPAREIVTGLRCGDEGWLVRVGDFLDDCLSQNLQGSEQFAVCAVKCLAVYRSVVGWVVPAAIVKASCVTRCCASLAAPSISIQVACVDALSALYLRSPFTDTDFYSLVCPMYTTEIVSLLRKVYEWSIVDAHDIDYEKYILSKKFSELLSVLGNFIDQKTSALLEDYDIPNLLNLFLLIAQSESFVVSIPILVTWTRLLKSSTIGGSANVTNLVAPLLELCSSRLVRYESMPEDSDDPCMVFLLEDMDTIPERHAFLGNYRRYSVQVIECIVRRKRSEAIYHILGQVAYSLQHIYEQFPAFSYENYSKTSPAVLRVDAQFTVVEAALKGYMKWRSLHVGKLQTEIQEERDKMENDFEIWCNQLLDMNFPDPIIRKRILQLCVAFSTSALDKKSAFMLRLLESILTIRSTSRPDCPSYTEGAKELQNECLHEILRIATKMPDQLLEVYDMLEAKINEIINTTDLDVKSKLAYQNFLFDIILRASNINTEPRLNKLKEFVEPIKQLWQDPELEQSLTSFDSYCALLGLNRARDYMVKHQVHRLEDWSTLKLDDEGISIQSEIDTRLRSLAIRPTKAYLSCSTDRVEPYSSIWETSCALWQDAVPLILPNLLKLLGHSHTFYSPDNWTGLPAEMRSIVPKILSDRFWQAGISEGSKDEFYARVLTTKGTVEGLASSIRGAVRTTRDHCYQILYGLSRMDVHFFGFEELPAPLAQALFAEVHHLSSHQLINLLTLVRHLVDDCPVRVRAHFVPPILATCFAKMDSKVSSEWERLGQKQVASMDDDNLTDEMKEESILRQLTYNAVQMVVSALDPARTNLPEHSNIQFGAQNGNGQSSKPIASDGYPTMRKFCFSTLSILEPLLVFCSHAIRYRDSRCCGAVLRVFRSIVPEFAWLQNSNNASIREYISTSVLQACITSLHEPYFVDLQKDLAQLIATILIDFCPLTTTPREVLLSLPGMTETSVDKCISTLGRIGVSTRQQRALVLDLLADLKGVSISEMGRMTKTAGAVRKERSKMQQEFMRIDEKAERHRGDSPNLEGMASMFEP